MTRFVLRSKQNCEVFDGTNLSGAHAVVIYRITLEHVDNAELKIITDGVQPKIIAANSIHKTIDVAVKKNLFLEALGQNGVVAGSYDVVSK